MGDGVSVAIGEKVTFELAELVRGWKDSHRIRRIIAQIGLSVFGVFFIGIGIYLGLIRGGSPILLRSGEGVVLVLAGSLIWASGWLSPDSRSVPTRLIVSPLGFSLNYESGKEAYAKRWDDRKLQLQLRDLRQVKLAHRDAPHAPALWLLPSAGLWVPIPESAFNAVMALARSHQLQVDTSAGVAGERIVKIACQGRTRPGSRGAA